VAEPTNWLSIVWLGVERRAQQCATGYDICNCTSLSGIFSPSCVNERKMDAWEQHPSSYMLWEPLIQAVRIFGLLSALKNKVEWQFTNLWVLPYRGFMCNWLAILIIMAANPVSSFHLADWSTLWFISKCFGLNCPLYCIHKTIGGLSSQQISDAYWCCGLDFGYCAMFWMWNSGGRMIGQCISYGCPLKACKGLN
jgi:hypothetical protein